MSNQIIPDQLAPKTDPLPGEIPDETGAKTKTWTLYSPDGAQSIVVDANTDLSAYDGWTKKKSA